MREDFTDAMIFLLKMEGGISNDTTDRGGLTNFGITAEQYPDLDISTLEQQDAAGIYYDDYWLPCKCNELKSGLSIAIFDTAVNCGQPSAIRWLQKALNLRGNKLLVDGIIGSKTINAASADNPCKLINLILAFRLQRYSNLVESQPEQGKFLRGWVNRVASLIFYVA